MDENIYYVDYNHNELMQWYTNKSYNDIIDAYNNGHFILGRCLLKDKTIFFNIDEISEAQIIFKYSEIGKDYIKIIQLYHLRSDDIIENQTVIKI